MKGVGKEGLGEGRAVQSVPVGRKRNGARGFRKAFLCWTVSGEGYAGLRAFD